jgi:hypothetical protein
MSIRDWGRREPTPRQVLHEVDLIRLTFFEQTFRSLGFSARDARMRGYIAYSIMMGDSILKETLRAEVATDEFVEIAVRLLSTKSTGSGSARSRKLN